MKLAMFVLICLVCLAFGYVAGRCSISYSHSNLQIASIEPSNMITITGHACGPLNTIVGEVTEVTSRETFTIDTNHKGVNCSLYSQPNGPQLPPRGSTVVMLGFFMLYQRGSDASVTSHMERRQIVADSIRGQGVTPHTGGGGHLRFEVVFQALDIRVFKGPADHDDNGDIPADALRAMSEVLSNNKNKVESKGVETVPSGKPADSEGPGIDAGKRMDSSKKPQLSK